MAKFAPVLCVLLIAASCSRNPSERLAGLTQEFVYTTLAFSPSTATAAGLHEYRKQKLDNLLDDMSPPSLDKQTHFYEDFAARLHQLPVDRLTPEDRVDLGMLEDQTALALLDVKEIHSALHNPTRYVETVGNALFTPLVLEYASKPARFQNIIARLEKIPLFLDQANGNLLSAPLI